MKKKIVAVGVLSFLVLVLAGCGANQQEKKTEQSANQQNDKNQEKNVPQSTGKNACEGKIEGDNCELTMVGKDNEKIPGTCKKMKQKDLIEEKIVCVPNGIKGGPEGLGSQPPQQQQ